MPQNLKNIFKILNIYVYPNVIICINNIRYKLY